jgi:hypothetical protein
MYLQKVISKKFFYFLASFLGLWRIKQDPETDPDPLVSRSVDQDLYQNVTDPEN